MWSSYQSVQGIQSIRPSESKSNSNHINNIPSNVINGSNRPTNTGYTAGFLSRLEQIPQKPTQNAVYPSHTFYLMAQSPALNEFDEMSTGGPVSLLGDSLVEEYLASRIIMNSNQGILKPKPNGLSVDAVVEAEADDHVGDSLEPVGLQTSCPPDGKKLKTQGVVPFPYPIRGALVRRNKTPWHILAEGNRACRRPSRLDFI